MRKSIELFLPVVLTFMVLVFGSCIPVEDDDLNPVDKFVGTWSVSDQAVRLNYQVVVWANPLNSSEVLLDNYADLGSTAVGLVVGSTIVLDSQLLSETDMVSGTGSYVSNTKLTFDYQLNDGIDTESRTAVFTK